MIGKGDFFVLICLYRKFTSPRKKYKKHSPTAFYEWDQKVCERTICNMRIAGIQYANGKSAIRILFPCTSQCFLSHPEWLLRPIYEIHSNISGYLR